jgi:hypothetical protein
VATAKILYLFIKGKRAFLRGEKGKWEEVILSIFKFFQITPSMSPFFPFPFPLLLTLSPLLYKTPLELGIIPTRRVSISTAIRIALANALNVASIM